MYNSVSHPFALLEQASIFGDPFQHLILYFPEVEVMVVASVTAFQDYIFNISMWEPWTISSHFVVRDFPNLDRNLNRS